MKKQPRVEPEIIRTWATFSPCRQYRYTLWRVWDEAKPPCAFICLNPSTADETVNDPTVTRCIRYSQRWGYGSFCMLNIFAFRATDPKVMKRERDPVGFDNNDVIRSTASEVGFLDGRIVLAWGNDGLHLERSASVMQIVREAGYPVACLGITGKGQPKHPLYLRNDQSVIAL